MWLVAVLVGLLAVGSGTAVGAQTSPAPTPSPSVVPSTEVTTDDYAAGDEPRDVDEPAPISDDVMGPAAEGVIAPGPPKDSSKAATPQASLMAPAALTEASGPWQYWISSSNPATGQTMTPGQTVTYTLNARRSTGDNGAAVTGAVVTMGLTGGATFTSVSGAGGNNGTVTLNGSTLTWQGMNLNGTGNTQTTRTVTVTATVDPLVLTGSLVGTVSPGATNGAFWSGTGRTQSVTHPVLGPGVCNFADPGSGAFAQSICWFDLARYNPTQAASSSGQAMQQVLPNGYRLSYTIRATNTSGSGVTSVATVPLPTWSGGFLGNPDPVFPNNYQGIDGSPAIYQTTNGHTTILTLSNIVLRNSAGMTVSGFALVGADAESTDAGESIRWTSDKPFTSIGPLGNACGGALTVTAPADVTCHATQTNSKTGAAILYSPDPTWFRQTMTGSGLQGVAFGVMVSGVQLTKQIVNRVGSTDAFTITAARGTAGSEVLATATTNASGFADTGQLHMIASGANSLVTLSEVAVAGTNSGNYVPTWSCTRNNQPYSPEGTNTSKTVTVAFGDFINCAITNTGPTLTLTKTVDNTAGGALAPGNWSLKAANSSATAVINEAPSHTPTHVGAKATASTSKVSVPVGQYTLSELSVAAGQGQYAPGMWTCTAGGQNVPVANNNVIAVAAGAQVQCGITNTFIPPARVSITKVLQDTTGTPLGDASGWSFTAALLAGTNPAVTLAPAGAQTSVANGTVPQPWAIQFPDATQTASVVVSEQQRDGYGLVGGVCTVTPLSGSPSTVTFTNSTNATIPNVKAGDQVNCVITNQQLPGSVTWSKVASGMAHSLLAGSEWTLTGPGLAANTVVIDCTDAACANAPVTDQVSTAGQFELANLAWGSYTLTESKAPAGYQLDTAPEHTFTISATSLAASIGPVVNEQLAVPELPLTGGLSTDLFLALGTGLLAAAGIGALIYRRRSAATSPN